MAVVLLGLVEVRSQSIAHPQTTCLLVLLLMYMFLIRVAMPSLSIGSLHSLIVVLLLGFSSLLVATMHFISIHVCGSTPLANCNTCIFDFSETVCTIICCMMSDFCHGLITRPTLFSQTGCRQQAGRLYASVSYLLIFKQILSDQ